MDVLYFIGSKSHHNNQELRYSEALALERAYQRWKLGKIMEQLTTLSKE